MSNKYDYDPGTPYEPPPRRRRRRPDYKRSNEYDDAWAAADEAEDDFGNVEIEGLAAGYHWDDDPQYGVYGDAARDRDEWRQRPAQPRPRNQTSHPNVRPHTPPANLGPLPNSVSRVRDRRPYEVPRVRSDPDPRSRSYHRDRARRGEYAEYYDPNTTPPPGAQRAIRPPGPTPGIGGIPYWQILAVVVFSVLAMLATALACASVLTL